MSGPGSETVGGPHSSRGRSIVPYRPSEMGTAGGPGASIDGAPADSEVSMMDLEQRVSDYFRAESGRFGLDPENLEAERILNWGGFGGYSYTVGGGDRTIHVKLTTEPADL